MYGIRHRHRHRHSRFHTREDIYSKKRHIGPWRDEAISNGYKQNVAKGGLPSGRILSLAVRGRSGRGVNSSMAWCRRGTYGSPRLLLPSSAPSNHGMPPLQKLLRRVAWATRTISLGRDRTGRLACSALPLLSSTGENSPPLAGLCRGAGTSLRVRKSITSSRMTRRWAFSQQVELCFESLAGDLDFLNEGIGNSEPRGGGRLLAPIAAP